MKPDLVRSAARSPRALRGLLPFLRPYRGRITLALLFLLGAAATTLALPVALKSLIDGGLVGGTTGERVLALRGHFLALFGVGVAMGVLSAARFYMVSWLGERITADLRNAVYAHVVRQSPEFFETTQTGEVLSRLTTDTTLVQTVVGSSFSLGLRNTVMGIGALGMLVATNPRVMLPVLGILALVVLPTLVIGRRVRRLSRASQDRVADSSAIAAEVLNAIPVVQSYAQQQREAARFDGATERAFETARRRTQVRSVLVAFIIIATFGALLWGLYQGTQAVLRGDITPGHLGQTVVYVIVLAGSVAVLSEVYGELLRAAGATERLWSCCTRARRWPSRCGRVRCRRCGVGHRCGSRAWVFTTRRGRRSRHCRIFRSTCGRAKRWRWWGRAARARARCCRCCCASTTCRRAASWWTVCR